MSEELLKEGRTAAMIGDLEKARRLFRAAGQEMPDNPMVWLELAGVVETLEEKQSYFKKVLALDPDNIAAQAGLDRVKQKLTPPETETGIGVCYRHPEVETGLRCNRCNQLICPQCAHRTPVGFRCPDCILEIEDRFYRNYKGKYLNPFDKPLAQPFFTYLFLGVNVLIWLAMEIAGGSQNGDVLLRFGANYGPSLLNGELWRLFTSIFLHIGIQHLMFNSIGLLIFGFEMERFYGPVRYLAIYLLAGLFGNLVSFTLKGPWMFSAGASGAIFGVIGMQLAFFVLYRHLTGEYGRQRRKTVWILVVISLVLGFTVLPSDNAAHMGGLAAGFVLGYLLAPRYQADRSKKPSRIIDKGSLFRRWWVSVLALIILGFGLWFNFAVLWTQFVGGWSSIFSTASNTEKTLEYGQTVEATLESDEGDVWIFEGETGQIVSIGMDSDEINPILELYGPSGQGLMADDDQGEGLNALIERYPLPETGTYIIVAYSLDGDLGPYQLTLDLLQEGNETAEIQWDKQRVSP